MWEVRRFEEIDSTNTYLRTEARNEAPDGVVAVAEHQTAGRGRLDRTWESPAGASLLFSVLLRPQIDPAELHLCTAAVALAAAEACRTIAGVEPRLKWPNDLLVGESKLAGVLAEAEFEAGKVSAVIVGIGINVGWPGPEGVGGTCLDDLAATPVDRVHLLDAILSAFTPRRTQLDSPTGRHQLATELQQRCATIGQQVRIELASGDIVGRATGINEAGHLIVETMDGTQTIAAGDVVHLRPSTA
ncbi:MAG TPA: biotin--[acetyl-CoA-carboxylase] ligase [Acidimicrobiales bacterium]|jgi:BirA family biotin operon repressor/biotin-[acetyl-CoA-carboxylase] ligase